MKRLWREYRASLKAPEVEEVIDLLVHRPLAFLVAKVAFRTSFSANQITLLSMLIGIVAGLLLIVQASPWHLVAACLVFVSQVLDCADGMVARMRKSSSEIGRMLDGVSDSVTLTFVCVGTTWSIVAMHPRPLWLAVGLVVAAIVTAYTGSLQTMTYDHYKNLFLRMTRPGDGEEDLEEALVRYERRRAQGLSLARRFIWWVYLGYQRRNRRFFAWFDPHTAVRLRTLPPYEPARADIYRRHALGPLALQRSLYGVGFLAFGFALFNAIGHPDWFLVFRLGMLTPIFFLVLWPWQRRASRRAFAASGITPATDAACADDARWNDKPHERPVVTH